MGKLLNQVGKRFGKLLVISRVPSIKGERGISAKWNCVCDCGNKRIISSTALQSTTKACKECAREERQKEDLTGRKSGKLLVLSKHGYKKGCLYWNCLCDCGQNHIARGADLRLGKINSCGCSRKKYIDLIGEKYGIWIVLRKEGIKESTGDTQWLCKCCDCGKEKVLTQHYLVHFAKNVTCRGHDTNDLFVGAKIGKWSLLNRVADKKDKTYAYSKWLCKCECGTQKEVFSNLLSSGGSLSCGCSIKRDYEEIPLFYFEKLKKQAEKRKLSFSLTIEELWDKYLEQNRMCFYTKIPIFFKKRYRKNLDIVSVDRINSKLGYSKNNIHLVLGAVNIMKNNLPMNTFLFFCRTIGENFKNTEIHKVKNLKINFREPRGQKVLMKVDEAFALDHLSILNIKYKNIKPINKQYKNEYFECFHHLENELPNFYRILKSKEYKNLYKANQSIFNLIDKMREDKTINPKDLDDLNMERFYAKQILQKELFGNELKETKIIYDLQNSQNPVKMNAHYSTRLNLEK